MRCRAKPRYSGLATIIVVAPAWSMLIKFERLGFYLAAVKSFTNCTLLSAHLAGSGPSSARTRGNSWLSRRKKMTAWFRFSIQSYLWTTVKLKGVRAYRVLLRPTFRSTSSKPIRPHIAPKQPLEFHRRPSLIRMASTGVEADLKKLSLIENSYPQAKDADSNPAKLSSAIFPSVEVGMWPSPTWIRPQC